MIDKKAMIFTVVYSLRPVKASGAVKAQSVRPRWAQHLKRVKLIELQVL
jgi:hypothetical protein